MAQLAATVYVTDPDTHQMVTLHPGTCPEPRLAALVTNPAAWVDGKLPNLPKKADSTGSPTGDGQDGASGDASDAPDDADPTSTQEDTTKAAPAAKKTAARKTAATSRSRGRDAAEGDSGE